MNINKSPYSHPDPNINREMQEAHERTKLEYEQAREIVNRLEGEGVKFYTLYTNHLGGGAPTYTTRQETTLIPLAGKTGEIDMNQGSFDWSFWRQFKEGKAHVMGGGREESLDDILKRLNNGETVQIGDDRFGSIIMSKKDLNPGDWNKVRFGTTGNEDN